MKLCISSYSLSRWRRETGATLEDTIDAVADLGVSAIEFSGLDDAPKPLRRAEALRRYAERKKIEIASYSVGAELLRPAAEQAMAVAALQRDVDVAAALGVRRMRHDITRGFGEWSKGVRSPKTFAGAMAVIVPAVREVADYAKTIGVRTSLENHGFYMQESKRVEALLRKVDHPNFGLTMDMGNFLCVNENPVSAVRRLAKYAQMVHVKDFHVRPKKSLPLPGWFATPTPIALRGAIVGHGVIDIPKQIGLLKKAAYRGFLSLEFEGLEEPLKAVRMGVDYLRQLI